MKKKLFKKIFTSQKHPTHREYHQIQQKQIIRAFLGFLLQEFYHTLKINFLNPQFLS